MIGPQGLPHQPKSHVTADGYKTFLSVQALQKIPRMTERVVTIMKLFTSKKIA